MKNVCLKLKCSAFVDPIRIIPILKDEKFCFIYEVMGFRRQMFEKVYIKLVSGSSGFVDYLVFWQEEIPTIKDTPLLLIEETKTDDSESRNTGVYQRCTKFITAGFKYPNVPQIMFYNLKISQKKVSTETNIFGTRMLKTLGVEIVGKDYDDKVLKPFETFEELIRFKRHMRKAPKGNVPIEIEQKGNKIFISARLIKADCLAHDPNVGALSVICASLRKLGWQGSV